MNSHLFLYYPKSDFASILDSLHACIGLQIQLLDASGEALLTYGTPPPYCKRAEACLRDGKTCRQEHDKACLRAIGLGEPYIFCCHSGVYHIIYPLVNREQLFGSILVGPFLMDGTDDDLIKHLAKASEIPTDTVLELYKEAHTIRELSPEQVVNVSRLLYYLVNSLISGTRELQKSNRDRLLQQSMVGESIQRYKLQDPEVWRAYPLEKERELLSEAMAGNVERARTVFNDLLALLFLYERYDTEGVKIRLIEICALLSRAAMEHGADVKMMLALNKELISYIMGSLNINEIGYKIHDNLDIFTESLHFSSESPHRAVKKATDYIHTHISEKITLASLAQTAGVSPPYLSLLFKQVTGDSFHDYLNKVRIDEAKRLLTGTEYPLAEIAVACGFNDQSYFCKVFKKYTGLPPVKYRIG